MLEGVSERDPLLRNYLKEYTRHQEREAIARMSKSPLQFRLGFTPGEYDHFGALLARYLPISGDTWLRRMYSRWRIMSAIEACQRGLKPEYQCGPLTTPEEFYNARLGQPHVPKSQAEYRGELRVLAEYASDEILTESRVIAEVPRVDFDKPITAQSGEEVKFDMVWTFDPSRPSEPAMMFGYIPQPPAQPEIVCPCCKGSGTYTGFLKVEPCEECKGTGKVKGSKPPDQGGAKGTADIDYSALGLMRQDREFG